MAGAWGYPGCRLAPQHCTVLPSPRSSARVVPGYDPAGASWLNPLLRDGLRA